MRAPPRLSRLWYPWSPVAARKRTQDGSPPSGGGPSGTIIWEKWGIIQAGGSNEWFGISVSRTELLVAERWGGGQMMEVGMS